MGRRLFAPPFWRLNEPPCWAHQEEARALEAKYEAQYAPLYTRRAALVSGAQEADGQDAASTEDAPPGVPDFWLIALRNHEAFEAMVTEKDAAVLAFLTDISSAPLVGEVDADGDAVHGFSLTFTFAANPFFSNAVLTKKYVFADEEESYLVKSVGCPIAWQAGKNTCVKVMKKKGKAGKGGAPAKVLTKLEPCDSFFNFFAPPDVPENEADADEEDMEKLQDALEADTELGSASPPPSHSQRISHPQPSP